MAVSLFTFSTQCSSSASADEMFSGLMEDDEDSFVPFDKFVPTAHIFSNAGKHYGYAASELQNEQQETDSIKL